MNATATPAKVAPIKARVPLMQDENSGKDGRRFNEWLANRPDSRLRAREAAEAIASEQLAGPVPAREKPLHFAAWLTGALITLFTGLSLWHLAANLLEASPR